ncbi:MAG: response regulator [Pirellulaceae bacterium]
MSAKVLLVDDDPNILEGFKRQLRKTYNIATAVGGAEGLTMLKSEGPFAVVVSDMQMPNMSGVEFLSKVREQDEHIVRIMLTGNADQKTAVDAVNEGEIFRFLNKPCPTDQLIKSIAAGLDLHRLVTAEAELLSKTLSGSVRILTQVLSMTMPHVFGLGQEARNLCREIATRMAIEPLWQIEMAAMLMRIGCVSLPQELLKRHLQAETLSDSELKLINEANQRSYELVSAIPRLLEVAEMIREQLADHPPPSSRILRAVSDYQRFCTSLQPLQAVKLMAKKTEYDPVVIDHLLNVIESMFQSHSLEVSQLAEGMVFEENVTDLDGRILVAKGIEVHASMIDQLLRFKKTGRGVKEPLLLRSFAQKTQQQ